MAVQILVGKYGRVYIRWSKTPADTEDFVDRVTKYLNEQYMTASEKEAAKVCGYSVSYFSKLFNHTFGQSFRDRLLKVKA